MFLSMIHNKLSVNTINCQLIPLRAEKSNIQHVYHSLGGLQKSKLYSHYSSRLFQRNFEILSSFFYQHTCFSRQNIMKMFVLSQNLMQFLA